MKEWKTFKTRKIDIKWGEKIEQRFLRLLVWMGESLTLKKKTDKFTDEKSAEGNIWT
jgi:hypothetical protein